MARPAPDLTTTYRRRYKAWSTVGLVGLALFAGVQTRSCYRSHGVVEPVLPASVAAHSGVITQTNACFARAATRVEIEQCATAATEDLSVFLATFPTYVDDFATYESQRNTYEALTVMSPTENVVSSLGLILMAVGGLTGSRYERKLKESLAPQTPSIS